MGQAKNRGTFEERKSAAIKQREEYEQKRAQLREKVKSSNKTGKLLAIYTAMLAGEIMVDNNRKKTLDSLEKMLDES